MTGCEWLVDAYGCSPSRLRSPEVLAALFDHIVRDLSLRAVAPPVWHQFTGEGGITGVVLLSESHLTCHTFPEHGHAAFNLYCCRPRADWDWAEGLREALGALDVHVRTEPRGAGVVRPTGRDL